MPLVRTPSLRGGVSLDQGDNCFSGSEYSPPTGWLHKPLRLAVSFGLNVEQVLVQSSRRRCVRLSEIGDVYEFVPSTRYLSLLCRCGSSRRR